MYVCSCHAVTEQRVREEIDRGAATPRQVARGCRAGTDCGSCVRRIQALLGQHGARPCPTPRLAARLGLAAAPGGPGDGTAEAA
ncbi:bacterioferritin-associated ferredoxin [Streptacidiphilus sp. ASG 303]|uniref:(2Fe-2S)-binding protein n=1 Tax=Streptomycetaceae TaxID=2062 RepID=UPI001E632626|nr:(2Fe-2S)-binding protein [Streptacidiphilus sp. ASG 303]MCD0481664.1 (2Fe-2S)-binding protein [Streptacidiphilus sp. ASG 303]